MTKINIITILLICVTFQGIAQIKVSVGCRTTIMKSLDESTMNQVLAAHIANAPVTGRLQPKISYSVGLQYILKFKNIEIGPEINYAINSIDLIKKNYTALPVSEYEPLNNRNHILETNIIINERLISDFYLTAGLLTQINLYNSTNNVNYNNDMVKPHLGGKIGLLYKMNKFNLQVTDQYSNSIFSLSHDNRPGHIVSFTLLYNLN